MEVPAGRPAPAVKLVSTSRVGGFDWTFRWDFDLRLDTPDLDESFDLVSPPWPGEWSVRVLRRTDGEWVFQIKHDGMMAGQLGEDVSVSVGLFWGDEGRDVRVARDDYETGSTPGLEATTGRVYNAWDVEVSRARLDYVAAGSKGRYSSSETTRYRLQFCMWMDKASSTASETQLAPAFHGSDASPVVNDIRLFFPRVGSQGAELWASARLLSRSSPYLRDMLMSDFAESVKIGAKRPRTSPAPAKNPPPAPQDVEDKHVEDSDNETDELLVKHRPPSISRFTKTAFSTYSAVLRFLETGFIRFAPLSSACTSVGGSAPPARADRITELVKYEPDLPFPISPKSTFRLAHLLELDRLKRISLVELHMQLSPSNASAELFDDASVCHEDWRQVVLDYVVANWDAVSATASWKDITGRVDRDEVPGAASILLALMRAKGVVSV